MLEGMNVKYWYILDIWYFMYGHLAHFMANM
jgi:hypothetical protein